MPPLATVGSVVDTDSITLSRVEAAAVLGAALVLVSMPLPWVGGMARGTPGYAYGAVSPLLAVGGLLCTIFAVTDPYPRTRYALLSLVGVTQTAWGVILVLGIPTGGLGLGVPVFILGGLLIASGGYIALRRETSTLKATTVVCGGGLILTTTLLIVVIG